MIPPSLCPKKTWKSKVWLRLSRLAAPRAGFGLKLGRFRPGKWWSFTLKNEKMRSFTVKNEDGFTWFHNVHQEEYGFRSLEMMPTKRHDFVSFCGVNLSQIWKFTTESWIWALSKIWIPTNIDSTFEPQKWADDNLDTTLAPQIWRLRQLEPLEPLRQHLLQPSQSIQWSTLWISGHFTLFAMKNRHFHS